ncbi:hypothetical protein SAMN06297251_13126 [Fulvimarina manganoxydans]|uniref:Uncharacterized protein n=1 Tax=Fulvimarina manganoxydans TaxID=937218 RepID=A0A1W2ER34_9HYPH|nr:hypothetical protein SAMN06297251_13126 [Fulvimarina manganoxydans]
MLLSAIGIEAEGLIHGQSPTIVERGARHRRDNCLSARLKSIVYEFDQYIEWRLRLSLKEWNALWEQSTHPQSAMDLFILIV